MRGPRADAGAPADGSGAMFDAIAPRYDALNRLLSLGRDRAWRRTAVEALRLGPGDEVLDVATGTADVAIEIARRWPGSRVVGVDPSEAMLRIGEAKVRATGEGHRIVLRRGDALDLPFEDRRFAGAIAAFGVRNFPDRGKGLREMRRVVREGGRVVILELTQPSSRAAVFWVRVAVPFVGRVLSHGPAYDYLRRSIAVFPPAAEFRERLLEAGLRIVEVRPLTLGAAHVFAAVREGPAT